MAHPAQPKVQFWTPWIESARNSRPAAWAGTAYNVSATALSGVGSFLNGAYKLVRHPQAEGPTVLYHGAQNAWSAAQWTWGHTPDPVKSAVELGAAYYTPVGWMIKAPAMAGLAYRALPEAAQQAIKEKVAAPLQAAQGAVQARAGAMVPYVEPVVNAGTAAVGAVIDEAVAIRAEPTRALTTAKKVWDNTPSLVKMAGAYFVPGIGWMTRAAAMAYHGYQALPAGGQQAVRQAAITNATAALDKAAETAVAAVPLAQGTASGIASLATAGVSYGVQTAIDAAPSAETVVGAIERVKQDPKQALVVAKEAWDAAPPLVKAGVIALAPVGPLISVPALASVAYNALPEDVQQPIRNAAGAALDAAKDKYPAIAPIIDGAGPLMEQAREVAAGPVVLAGHNINPLVGAGQPTIPDAAVPLSAIGDKASQMLEFVEANHIEEAAPPPEPVPAAPAQAPAPVQPPADPRIVTEACGPRQRIEATNWEKKANENLQTIITNVSNFAVLGHMFYNICGYNEEDGYTSVLELVNKASQPVAGKTQDLWDLFRKEYKIKLFSPLWWRCKFFYWSAYKWTSIIPNMIDAYLKEGMKELRSRLASKDNGQKRTNAVRGILDIASQLLDALNGACTKYADAAAPEGDLDDYKRSAVSERYGYSRKRLSKDRSLQKTLARRAETTLYGKIFDSSPDKHSMHTLQQLGEDYALENLCAKFAQRVMSEFSTYVPFFKGTKKIPIIGKPIAYLLKPVEWLLNGVIWWKMRYSILPSALKSAVEEGLDAAKPHNLPFSMALTKFFTDQFVKLKGKLAANPDSKPPVAIPGSEKLPDVVNKLRRALDLMPHQTKEALKAKLGTPADAVVREDEMQQAIRDGIVKASHVFLEFATDPGNFEEGVANVLELLNKPFTGSAPKDVAEWNRLSEDFQNQRKDLKREAHKVFEMIITEAVTEGVQGQSPEKAAESASQSFDKQKEESEKTFARLEYHCSRIREKVDANSADPANSIHPEIAAIAKRMKSFAQIQNHLEGLEPASREGINRVLSPLYVRADEITARMAALQTLQTRFSSHAQIAEELRRMQELLAAVPQQLQQAPQNLKDAIPHLETILGRIREHLPQDAPELAQFAQHIAALSQQFEAIARNYQILQRLAQLDPSGAGQPNRRNQGLIYQYANYQRYKKNPEALRRFGLQGFDQGACAKSLNQSLRLLDAQEQSDMRQLIRKMELFGNAPVAIDFDAEIWNPLTAKLQDIQQKYNQAKEAQKAALEGQLAEFGQNLQYKVDGYAARKQQNHEAMVQEITDANASLAALRAAIPLVEQEAQLRLTPQQLGVLTGAAGVLAGLAFGPVAGAVLGAAAHFGVRNLQGLVNDGRAGAVASTVGGMAGAGLAASVLPGAVGVVAGAAGAASGGANLPGEAIGAISKKVVPQVMQIFDAAYSFTLSPHISHAAATWGMKAIIDSKPSVKRSVFHRPLAAASA